MSLCQYKAIKKLQLFTQFFDYSKTIPSALCSNFFTVMSGKNIAFPQCIFSEGRVALHERKGNREKPKKKKKKSELTSKFMFT